MGVAVRRPRRAIAALALPGLLLVVANRTEAAPEPPDQPVVVEPNLQQAPAAEPAADVIDGSYIVVMAADPVVAYEGGEPGLAPTAPAVTGDEVDENDPAVVEYVDHLEAEQDAALAEAGVSAEAQGATFTYALSGFEAELSERQAAVLEREPTVAKVVPNTVRQLTTDNTPKFLGLTSRGGVWASGLTGEDVVVGVIDTGIWPEHPSFADTDYEPLDGFEDLPCEFGNTAHNPADAPFECNDKLLGAYEFRDVYRRVNTVPEMYNSARDYDGHGTHTTSTAAGNAGVAASMYGISRGTVSGIAPRARIIAYAVCGDQGCIVSDLMDAIDQAVLDGVDVINYSIGSLTPSLTGPDDMAFLFAADAGVWVSTSNGNDGPGAATGGSPANVPWVTAVGANTHDRTFASALRLGNGQIATGASITAGSGGTRPLVDAANLGNQLCDSTKPFSAPITGKIVLCLRGVNARVDKSKAVYDNGGAGMILYNPNNVQALVTDTHWLPSIHVNLTSGLAVKSYIAAAGANARAALTDGKKTPAQGSAMADFSSRGPNRAAPDIIKPDVTGPGVNVLAGNTPTPSPLNGAPGQLFQSISGTSMASPHVAGLFALLRQAHPDWSAAAAKSALMTSARQDVVKEDGSTPADPFDMGAGHVDPSGRPDRPTSPFEPGLVYDAGLFDYFGFLCGADDSIFVDPAGTCGALEAGGIPTAATDLNLASIGASNVVGALTVQRTVTSVADRTRTFVAEVDAPDGFEVTVSPDTLRLAPGESDTFEVTLTNTGTPDEWRFGSLTWVSGNYEVRSPIAVQGSLLAAPDEVSGEGTEGSVEFPVTFGFDGAYEAAPHGPVPNDPKSGTVADDPNGDFDPEDPAGTTAVPLTLSGSAFLRITTEAADLVPPDPNTDIDLYLYKDGEEVALSGSPASDEVIELVLPEDGEYTLYVHGFEVPTGSVAFTANTWSVPLQPGTGALTIDEAPTEVSKGETATIVASWTGLDADERYLGAVSHSNDDGLLGLTLVGIDT